MSPMNLHELFYRLLFALRYVGGYRERGHWSGAGVKMGGHCGYAS